jgi:hypothetical protein
MHKTIPVAGFIFALLLLVQAASAGSINITIADNAGSYARNQNLSGNVTITYSRYVPRNSSLMAYIDNVPVSSVSLYSKLYDTDYYSFVKQYFGYNIFAYGSNSWTEYPQQHFNYTVIVNGTCGGSYCNTSCPLGCPNVPSACTPLNPPASYPCRWSVSWSSDAAASVKGSDGLKAILNMSFLGLPVYQNNDTLWSVTDTNASIETTMRMACGGQGYAGYPVSPDGWVRQPLANLQQVQGGGTRYWTQLPPFDASSLDQNRSLYISDPSVGLGGIYRIISGQKEYMTYVAACTGQSTGTQAFWNGTTGYIEICNYNPPETGYSYIINFLPPNGPMVCAYTPVAMQGSSDWTKNVTIGGDTVHCDYLHPYARNYAESELTGYYGFFRQGKWPECPPGAGSCIRGIISYSVAKSSDPGNSVSVSFAADNRTVNVTAATSSADISRAYSIDEYLSSFSSLRAPPAGNHTLLIRLLQDSSILASGSMNFVTCHDYDGDGFCGSAEGGNDCNDTNAGIRPGSPEECNGVDDDCNGICWEGGSHGSACRKDSECAGGTCRMVDEEFYGTGRLGEQCGIGACEGGYYVCAANGSGVECSRKPGDEMCANNIDDDCDGYKDELYDYVKDNQIFAVEFANGNKAILKSGWETATRTDACIWCKSGDIRDCGSNIGRCRAGYSVCANKHWGNCTNEIPPETESCNRVDDDCDGVIDDVGGGGSAQASHCGCYDNSAPSPEECNDIDDDCDGQTDEGIICCNPGSTRLCSEGGSLGECAKGAQTCSAQGSWGECSVHATTEICYNELDDSCNGQADEGCMPEVTCFNSLKDLNEEGIDCGGPCQKRCETLSMWMIVGGVFMLMFVGVWLLVLKRKI